MGSAQSIYNLGIFPCFLLAYPRCISRFLVGFDRHYPYILGTSFAWFLLFPCFLPLDLHLFLILRFRIPGFQEPLQ